MKTLYTNEEFKTAKSKDTLPLQCYQCNKIFQKHKNEIVQAIKHGPSYRRPCRYCSRACADIGRRTLVTFNCTQCNKPSTRAYNQASKSKNLFCSKSCGAIYNNAHKTTGNRRSKLEIWLEEQLKILYPNLTILFNDKSTINSELDIYIPSFKLAIELNGIFHYEPIYGIKELNRIQNNNNRKFQACLEHGIELCIIDTTNQKYFKEKTSKQFLEIISKVINLKVAHDRVELSS